MVMTNTTADMSTRPGKGSRLYRIAVHAVRVCSLVALLLLVGFLIFAHAVSTMPSVPSRKADAIVALTGGEVRIAEAVRLLGDGRARRLLISGVNPVTTKPELINRNPRSAALFRCCVDLDKRALDTRDNATETTQWVRERGFRSLIVVTSSYHMPRSLIELRQTMPDVDLIPYPVRSPALAAEHWWADRYTLRVLAREYAKLVTAISRFAAHRLFEPAGEEPTQIVKAWVD